MGATYRRRVEGRGKRNAGKRRSTVEAGRTRGLTRLVVSVALFLLVFGGRRLFPAQAKTLGDTLRTDTDFLGAVAAFRGVVSDGGGFLEAAGAFWDAAAGRQPDAVESQTPSEPLSSPVPVLPPYADRAGVLGWSAAAPEKRTPEPEETAEPSPSAVTAVAQAYNEAGEALPKNVSLQYYELGLEETAVPVSGTVTSSFGFRDHPVSGAYSFHTAMDIGVKTGTDVLAFADGTVRYVGENSIFGLYIKVDHANGVSTFYAHCSEILSRKGEAVECGQVIAKSGETGNATGPHLHFSVEKDGVRLDPAFYLSL